MCGWEMSEPPTSMDLARRSNIMKETLNRISFEYDSWDLGRPIYRLKLLQFMIMCCYGQNSFKEYAQCSVDQIDSMPMKGQHIGQKRLATEPKEEEKDDQFMRPEHERMMSTYNVLIQSTCVNVKFELRSEAKYKVQGGKNEVYKYSGLILKKGHEGERFTRLTLAELRERTGLKLDSLTSRRVPGMGEVLTAIDGVESKLKILAGDIDGMLREFADEIKDGLSGIDAKADAILGKLEQMSSVGFPDAVSFSGNGESEELKNMRAELAKKDRIISQQQQLIKFLQGLLDEANK